MDKTTLINLHKSGGARGIYKMDEIVVLRRFVLSFIISCACGRNAVEYLELCFQIMC